MKKFLVGSVFAVAAAYGGFKVYVWYEISQTLSTLKKDFAPLGTFDYNWISSSLNGEVKVEGLRITPFFLKDTVTIDAVALKVPGVMDLLKLSSDLNQKQPPDALEWRIENARIGTASPFWEEFGKDQLSQALETIACGDITSIGPKQWREMGYNHFDTSLHGGYRLDRFNQTFKIYLNADTQAVAQTELELNFKLASQSMHFGPELVAQPPQLSYARIAYKDDSYTRRISHLCRKQANLSEADYAIQSANRWQQALKGVGLEITDDIKQAYKLWLAGDKRLLIELNPQQELDYALLPFIRPAEVLDLLGLVVRVDNYQVQDLALQWNKEKLFASFMSDEVIPAPVALPAKKAQSAPVPQQTYQKTAADQLHKYQNYPIKVVTTTGKSYEGRLTDIGITGLKVSAYVSGGTITYPVPIGEIEQVEVFR